MPGELHDELAVRALRWLARRATGKGIRGATEVRLANGYVADAAALASLMRKYAIEAQAPGWSNLVEPAEHSEACVFEVKASRGDFLSTFGTGDRHRNRRVPIGNLHWCVTVGGVAEPDELPEFWGLLEASGTGLCQLRPPIYCPVTDLNAWAYAIIWPMGATRYNRNVLRVMEKLAASEPTGANDQ